MVYIWENLYMTDKKNYLKQYLAAKRKVRLLLDEIAELRDSQTSPVGLGDGMPKGNMKSDLSGYMAKLDALLRELEAEQEIQMIKYQEIRNAIKNMENDTEQEILIRRYILGQSWEKIAIEMRYSQGHILKIHGKALQNFSVK